MQTGRKAVGRGKDNGVRTIENCKRRNLYEKRELYQRGEVSKRERERAMKIAPQAKRRRRKEDKEIGKGQTEKKGSGGWEVTGKVTIYPRPRQREVTEQKRCHIPHDLALRSTCNHTHDIAR